jgi:hypothetical protein
MEMRSSEEIIACILQTYEDAYETPQIYGHPPAYLECVFMTLDWVHRYGLRRDRDRPNWVDYRQQLGVPNTRTFVEWFAERSRQERGADPSNSEIYQEFCRHWKQYIESQNYSVPRG